MLQFDGRHPPKFTDKEFNKIKSKKGFGEASGEGGAKYEGQLVEGRATGYGKYTNANGSIGLGHYLNGKPHGYFKQ